MRISLKTKMRCFLLPMYYISDSEIDLLKTGSVCSNANLRYHKVISALVGPLDSPSRFISIRTAKWRGIGFALHLVGRPHAVVRGETQGSKLFFV